MIRPTVRKESNLAFSTMKLLKYTVSKNICNGYTYQNLLKKNAHFI